MLRVALTGGIATGKSYVRRLLEARGLPAIDADVVAREVVAPGSPGLEAIVARFGRAVLSDGGQVDRARLATLVFGDWSARRDLEAIVHPRVFAAIEAWLEQTSAAGAPVAVADIPLLFETGRAGAFDVVVVAACSPEQQVARLQARDALSGEEARRRIAAQWPIAEKRRLADLVVDTSGSLAQTDTQAISLVEELLRRSLRAG